MKVVSTRVNARMNRQSLVKQIGKYREIHCTSVFMYLHMKMVIK